MKMRWVCHRPILYKAYLFPLLWSHLIHHHSNKAHLAFICAIISLQCVRSSEGTPADVAGTLCVAGTEKEQRRMQLAH